MRRILKLPFLAKRSQPAASTESMELVLAKLDTLLAESTARPVVVVPRCLVLDVSASMASEYEPGVSKIQALRKLVAELPAAPTYAFATGVRKVTSARIPEPDASTDLAGAFDHIKRDGHHSAVLITDGQPDSEEAALDSARGLQLEIFYVGPPPKPEFLDQLAAITGGRAEDADLSSYGRQELETKIRGLLA
jgi:hypothetical protein